MLEIIQALKIEWVKGLPFVGGPLLYTPELLFSVFSFLFFLARAESHRAQRLPFTFWSLKKSVALESKNRVFGGVIQLGPQNEVFLSQSYGIQKS